MSTLLSYEKKDDEGSGVAAQHSLLKRAGIFPGDRRQNRMMRDSYTRVSTEVNPSSASHLFPLGTFSPTVGVGPTFKSHPPPKTTPPFSNWIRFDSLVDSPPPPPPLPRTPLRSWTSKRCWKRTQHQQKPKQRMQRYIYIYIYIYNDDDDDARGQSGFEGQPSLCLGSETSIETLNTKYKRKMLF